MNTTAALFNIINNYTYSWCVRIAINNNNNIVNINNNVVGLSECVYRVFKNRRRISNASKLTTR